MLSCICHLCPLSPFSFFHARKKKGRTKGTSDIQTLPNPVSSGTIYCLYTTVSSSFYLFLHSILIYYTFLTLSLCFSTLLHLSFPNPRHLSFSHVFSDNMPENFYSPAAVCPFPCMISVFQEVFHPRLSLSTQLQSEPPHSHIHTHIHTPFPAPRPLPYCSGPGKKKRNTHTPSPASQPPPPPYTPTSPAHRGQRGKKEEKEKSSICLSEITDCHLALTMYAYHP